MSDAHPMPDSSDRPTPYVTLYSDMVSESPTTHDAPTTAAPGAWSVAMNLAHLVTYEEQLALPVLRAMAHGSDGEGTVRSGLEHWFHADAVALSSDPVDLLVSRLRAAREEQIRTIEPLTDDAFNTPRTRLFTDPG